MRSERVIAGRPVQLEVISTPIFADPDGDPLTIAVGWELQSGTPGAWNGLRIVGDRLEGIAAQPDTNAVSISANDGRGGLAIYRIEFTVAANQAPSVRAPAPDHLVGIGEAVHFDATQSGAVFVDPDGDPLNYSVTFEPAPRGLQVTGTTVTGQLSAVGAVRVIVSASDGFGGIGSDTSMVAAPAAQPGAPHLPALSYAYDDSLLDWPENFRLSREITIPFWDTTPPDNPTTNAGATLGRVLFYDKRALDHEHSLLRLVSRAAARLHGRDAVRCWRHG